MAVVLSLVFSEPHHMTQARLSGKTTVSTNLPPWFGIEIASLACSREAIVRCYRKMVMARRSSLASSCW